MSFLSPSTKNDCSDVNPHKRVVLLLDMDCFYAQCETVRLGLDQSMPLALVQWRSALAVNYPARKFGIKRGDSFEVIQEKSKGKCVAIHLEVTPVDEQYTTTSPTKSPKKDVPFNEDWCKAIAMPGYEAVMSKSPRYEVENLEDGDSNKKGSSSTISPKRDTSLESSESAYDEEFNQPKEVRDEMYRLEKNKMRSPSEGKACLDRYRLASSRIFSLIDETLAENLGRKNYILERASIDELFIDVTAFCYQSAEVAEDDDEDCKDKPNNDAAANNKNISNNDIAKKFRATCDEAAIESLKDTVIYNDSSLDPRDKNDQIGNAIKLGCLIALTARRAVLNKLGFTLSAGISTNKLVSKLGATYGKPNGQAVVFPGAINTLMEETQLRKARMLGGKLGKRVSSLLPESETTMGSISRLLSLDQLEKALGEESARWVFDACRGIDYEEVKPTLKVLPKSITAFKSFPKVSYPELEKWTALLARDIMKRVETDNARNNRIPKAITVGYTMVPGGAWIGKTFRLPFPQDKDFDARIQRLVDSTRNVLTERGHSSFIRIGFSAIDFVVRPKVGIDSFFNKGKTTRSSSTTTKLLVGGKSKKDSGINNFFASKKPSPKVEATAAAATFPKPNSDNDEDNDTVTSGTTPKKSSPKDTSATANVGTPKEDESTEETTETTSDIAAQSKPDMTDEEMARHLQETYNKEVESQSKVITKTKEKVLDKDEAFALQLQNKFDRENEVLSHVERFPAKRKSNSSAIKSSKKKGSSNKRGQIDFFLKK